MANGQYIGELLGGNVRDWVQTMSTKGYLFSISKLNGQIVGIIDSFNLHYTTTNCTGTIYTVSTANGTVSNSEFLNGLYYTDKQSLPQLVTVNSSLLIDQSTGTATCNDSSQFPSTASLWILIPNDENVTGVNNNVTYSLPITIER